MARLMTPEEIALLPARLRRPTIKRHRIEGGRGEIYPYDEWADGQWRELRQGTDFDVSAQAFYANMKQWAKRNGGVDLEIRVYQGTGILMKLGPYNPEQQEIRRYYVRPGT